MANFLYKHDTSVLRHLKKLQEKYGVFHFIGGYVTASNPGIMARVFSDIRGTGEVDEYPTSIAGPCPSPAAVAVCQIQSALHVPA
jgi:hypothetical protein